MSIWQKLKHLFTKNGVDQGLEIQPFGCPSCKGEAITTELELGDKIKRCIGVTLKEPVRPSCGWSMHVHGTAMPERVDVEGRPIPWSSPVCGSKIFSVNSEIGLIWRCCGLANRAEVEEMLGKAPGLPPNLETKKPCGWYGKAEDFGRLWS